MERITKKSFIDTLCNGKSKFIASVFRKSDEWLTEKLKGVNPEILEKVESRKVTERHAEYITFSNGSRLDFDQNGTKEYYKHNENGIDFLIQKTTTFDEFDETNHENYIVYSI